MCYGCNVIKTCIKHIYEWWWWYRCYGIGLCGLFKYEFIIQYPATQKNHFLHGVMNKKWMKINWWITLKCMSSFNRWLFNFHYPLLWLMRSQHFINKDQVLCAQWDAWEFFTNLYLHRKILKSVNCQIWGILLHQVNLGWKCKWFW